jgi:hypothetical protein
MTIPMSVLERGMKAVAIYRQIVSSGETERWAEMCALQAPPGVKNTDKTFCIGQREKMERMDPATRQALIKAANQAGIQTDGKFYMSGLGGHTNPAAWVSCAEDVITSCKVQNKGVEGVLNYKAPKTIERPPPNVPLAEHLVAEMANKELKANPALAEKVKRSPKAKRELREKVIAKYGRKKR